MTKQFTTPCFIRNNTPELKAKLEEIGIPLNPLSKNHNDEVGLVVYSGTYFTIREENILDNVINCRENEPLFLALAAMNNSDDKDQWFIRIDTKELYLCKVKKFKCAKNIPGGFYRKATVPEIIEHFKTKE